MPTKRTDRIIAAGLAALAICLGALAIWGDDSGAAREATAGPASFRIVYERSGGYAPSTSRLVVGPGLHALAGFTPGAGAETTARFRISAERVEAIERGLRRAHFGRLRSAADIRCADCFFYEIAYRGHRIRLDQGQVPPRLEPVLAELEAIVTSHAIPAED